ncbi:MAG: ABC transporter substrate-binding protein [Chloroflexia bacterium]|nr:ABC transporter substrate-binding protein [Chloroflexia bacterium]MDQ3513900.1 ABC transporter substrate-binding protein [Chloroflexota bacterium]
MSDHLTPSDEATPAAPAMTHLLSDALRLRESRRSTLKRAAVLGLSVPAVAAALGPARRARAQDPITLTWFAARDPSGYTQQQVDAFNAQNPALQISYQEQGATTTDLHDKFVTIASAGDESADIVSMDVPFVPEFAAAGWTSNLSEALPDVERDAFYSGTIEGATYDGEIYGIPWYNNGPGLFYRKDLLDEAGIAPPKSYDELVTAAKQLQTADRSGFIFQAAQTEGGLISWLENLWGHGGEILNDEGEIALGEGTAAVDSLTRLVNFIYTDKISPEATLTMATGPDAQNVFVEGRAVFLRMWMTATAAMDADTSAVKGLWDVTSLPSATGTEPGPGCLGAWMLGISANSRYAEQSAEAIRFLTSVEQQTARYLGNGSLPARTAVLEDEEVRAKYAYVDRLGAAFESLKPRPVSPYYSQMSADVLQPNFAEVMTRAKEPEQAVNDMVEGIEQVLNS